MTPEGDRAERVKKLLALCECGKMGSVELELESKVFELEKEMGIPLDIVRGWMCKKCNVTTEGGAESGHVGGTDVDIAVYGQYYRHRALRYVSGLFPVMSLGPRVFHLSVRKDWPQLIAFIT